MLFAKAGCPRDHPFNTTQQITECLANAVFVSSKLSETRRARISQMLLETIGAQKLRNLSGGFSCAAGLNILLGDNGQGKTNWLEAIYLLATSHSFKTARLSEAITFGEDLAIARGRVRRSEGIHHDLQVSLQGNTKILSVNGKREPQRNYLSELHAVIFTADTLDIVRGHPESRRSFLDDAIVSLHPPFVQTFTDYSRVLKQKNSLLQKALDRELSVEAVAAELAPWNDQLVALAGRIHRGRIRVVERLNEVLEEHLFGDERVSIRYLSSLEGKADLSNYEVSLAERLQLRVHAELVAGHALVGPHRDDLEILFDGRDLRKYGSAGQQRSALLILQLANMAVFNATRGEYPLFLIDDIDAELDYKRIGKLLDFLREKTQTFVTTSKASLVQNFGTDAAVFEVRDGRAKPASD